MWDDSGMASVFNGPIRKETLRPLNFYSRMRATRKKTKIRGGFLMNQFEKKVEKVNFLAPPTHGKPEP